MKFIFVKFSLSRVVSFYIVVTQQCRCPCKFWLNNLEADVEEDLVWCVMEEWKAMVHTGSEQIEHENEDND